MPAPILIVGEAYDQHEAALGHPFVGPSGRALIAMLMEAGILQRSRIPFEPAPIRDFWLSQSAVALTNVFNFRPENNDVEQLCVNAAGHHVSGPPLRTGKYVSIKYQNHLERLAERIASEAPNLIIALGGTASWALLGDGGINRVRGAIAGSVGITGVVQGQLPVSHMEEGGTVPLRVVESGHKSLDKPIKVLPTFHPAAILRDWSLRHVTVMDLGKALRESAFPEIIRPARRIYVEPTLHELEWYWNEHLRHSDLISVDIETQGNLITCVGFAADRASAIVVPFRDNRKDGRSYWPTPKHEACAWNWIKAVCECGIPLLFQNGMYDSHFLWRRAGICAEVSEDTMLLHHSLQPEAKKGLGYLGACYTNEASWKLLNAEAKSRKKDD